ncbi:MAG: hypothetical protein KDC12_02115 [Flavobacteriales bacterium]|nr:hypothetical protein [Flavobacteriales bacterium]
MKRRVILFVALFSSFHLFAQLENIDLGHISGNVSLLWQQYNEDTLIGAQVPPEKAGFNAYGNLIYTRGNFSAGIRYESYLSPILGYPGRFKGTGIGYRYAQYTHQKFEITIGNFYDQFGSGMIFRTYEDRNLGYDNAMDGVRFIFRPYNGITLKGIYGHQRLDFDSRLINTDGIVRAADGEIFINDLIPALQEKKLKTTIGGSFVSKYQDGDIIEKDTLQLIVPNNVGAWAGRLNLQWKGLTAYGEYVHKINDPSADNGYTYRDGEALLVQLGYSRKGLGINVGGKMVDNMSYRSDRDLLLFDSPINYIPVITKQHTYNLAATLYPYATPLTGEASFMAEVFYKIPWGKYGTNVAMNFAAANNLDTTKYAGVDEQIYGFKRNSWGFGDTKYVRDFNVEVKQKFSKNFQLKLTYFYLEFNTTSTPVTTEFKGIVYADIAVAEFKYKLAKKHAIRGELQGLWTKQDRRDWATVLLEYTFSPHWFVSVLDQYNYSHPDPDRRIHYLFGTVGYINGSNRIALGYGKRREGIFCVGGVCRAVPASNGFEITVTSSF